MAAVTTSEKRRLYLIGVVLLSILCVLLGRLYYVQVAHTQDHLQAVRHQSIRRIRLNPVRGRIFARDGDTVLAGNKPGYRVVLHPAEMRQPGSRSETVDYIMEQLHRIETRLNRSDTLSRPRIKRHLKVYPALPLTAIRNLNKEEFVRIAEIVPRIQGMELKTGISRQHLYPEAVTHVLGFTGHRQPLDSYDRQSFSYVQPQLQGRAGLEKTFNSKLNGKGGTKLVRVDTQGFVDETVSIREKTERGNDVVSTIDAEAQKIAADLLKGKKGALVVLNVNNGAIIAMASAPTYNLDELDTQVYGKLANDEENRPLTNRAIWAEYLPGSIVKPLVGLSGLESGAIDPETRFDCHGEHKDFGIGCWLTLGHGKLNLMEALQHSCNVYFIEAGIATGMRRLTKMFRDAGFGHRPDIRLPYVGSGNVLSREQKKKQLGKAWISIDTAYLSIGQFGVTVSPLQATLYTASIANGGTIYKPYIVKAIRNPDGNIIKKTAPRPRQNLNVDKNHLKLIRKGMYQVVNSSDGTAEKAQNPYISLAGKTGTAEVIRNNQDNYNNAWFICYGPVQKPEYAMAILIEHGDSGGSTAAPLAAQFFTRWLK